MTDQNAHIAKLSESLIDELVGAVGLPKTPFTHRLGWSFFRNITDRLANIGAPFDEIVHDQGLPKAAEWCLSLFCDQVKVQGVENIPQSGPLLLTTNHPGSYDGLVIFSKTQRQDIKWISTEIPFLRLLPNLEEHILFASRQDSRGRMVVLRNAIQHMREGGVLVYFAAGHRDPDPAVYRGGSQALENWLDVFDMFFKYIPGLNVQPVIVSGVVSSHWSGHLLPKLRRKQIDQQRLAEFGQVISQLMHPGKIFLTPSVSFGKPFTEETLRAEIGIESTQKAIIERAKVLLNDHCRVFGGNLE